MGDVAALTRSSLICWENNTPNNKTMDPSPENNRAAWYQGPMKLEVVKSCGATPLNSKWYNTETSRARENRKFKNSPGLVPMEWRHGIRLPVSHPQRFNRALLTILKRLDFINNFDQGGKIRLLNPLLLSFCKWLLSIVGGLEIPQAPHPAAKLDLWNVVFQCSPFTDKFFERSGHKYQLADVVGFLVFLIGELTKKSCFLFGVVFAILLCKSKGSKRDDGEDYLQTTRHGLKINTAKRLQVCSESTVTCSW